jgi:hypothetical protein
VGYLDAICDPDDYSVRYSFVPAGHLGPVNMDLSRDFGRRESVVAIPGADRVLNANGRLPGAVDRLDQSFGFRVFTNGDNDAAYGLLAAAILPGYPVRLRYRTDAGALWYARGEDARLQHSLTSASSWGAGGYCDFAVTWRRDLWTPQFSEVTDVWAPVEPTWSAGDTEVWSNSGTTAIASAAQAFTLTATGTAGVDRPVLPDRAPKIFIRGPAGGASGIAVSSFTATTPDENGARQPIYFTFPSKLPTANDSAYFDFGSQSFWTTIGGATTILRPFKPKYQTEYFRVDPGVVNNCVVTALGASPATGGEITVDWRRYFG